MPKSVLARLGASVFRSSAAGRFLLGPGKLTTGAPAGLMGSFLPPMDLAKLSPGFTVSRDEPLDDPCESRLTPLLPSAEVPVWTWPTLGSRTIGVSEMAGAVSPAIDLVKLVLRLS